jgi:D-beta-D-heptose 7-phosphate kinase/D-beta-D-heptose 1-phosphate adenosyltransferase
MYKFDNFSSVKVLVVGDVMIDRYLWGEVSRISPEAPVPVVRLKKTELIAGGAANVAANIAGLGATPFLIGVIGRDPEGKVFPQILSSANVSPDYLVTSQNRRTTIKTRIIAHNQQIVRLDQETTGSLTALEQGKVWAMVEKVSDTVKVIVISDYNKGMMGENLVSRLIKYGKKHGKTVIVDPKGKDYTKYKNAAILTPNKFEAADACGLEGTGKETLAKAGWELLLRLKLNALLITRGEEGMTLFEKNKRAGQLKALARNVYDVTGAGDTVIAALAVAVGAGENYFGASEIANAAAGIVVGEIGTTTIKLKDLMNFFKEGTVEKINNEDKQ